MSSIDHEVGQPWYVRSGAVDATRHRSIWSVIAMYTGTIVLPFYSDIIISLVDKSLLRDPTTHRGCTSCLFIVVPALVIWTFYVFFFMIVCEMRLPGPYRLRRSEKLSFDCAFVVVCSFWTFVMRDRVNTTALGLLICFHVIAMLNLWWDYQNFGFLDCLLTAMIEAALFYGRDYVVILAAVAGVGVALQWKKNAYQEKCVKSSEEI